MANSLFDFVNKNYPFKKGKTILIKKSEKQWRNWKRWTTVVNIIIPELFNISNIANSSSILHKFLEKTKKGRKKDV